MRGGNNHVNRKFQTKTSQHKNTNLPETANPIESKFEHFEDQPDHDHRNRKQKFNMAEVCF